MDLDMKLIQQLALLVHTVNTSPYISRETRLQLAHEMDQLGSQLQEGIISSIKGAELLNHLNHRAAADEISNLSCKIGYLNPTSPRLENLRSLKQDLHTGVISASQARQKLQQMMHA